MIKSYIEIKVVPDIEFSSIELMSAMFLKLHVAYNSIENGKFAISFPDYSECNMQLGERIRLFSTKDNLEKLSELHWEKGLRDYLCISSIQSVPNDCSFAIFKRVQTNSLHRERKRKMSRANVSYEEACRLIPNVKETKLPFIDVKSLSTKSLARIYIKRLECKLRQQSDDLHYSSYGLSSEFPVPIF